MRLFLLLCALIGYTMAAATDTKAASLKAVSEGAETFSTQFFKTVANKNEGNLITSPLSADVVLSMAAYGARENTAKQMRGVLNMPADDNLSKSGYQNLIDTLNNVKDVELKLANKVFTNKDLKVKEDFKKLTADSFRSADEQLDFGKSVEAAASINNWCEEKTNHKIKELIKSDDLDASTAMVLVNAVYFKGQWKSKFNPEHTENKPFHIDSNTTKDVPTMYQKTNIIYGELPDMKAKFVEIPYKGDEVSMVIVLPDEGTTLKEVEEKMATTNLRQMRQSGYHRDVELYLPKFKIESTIQLNDVLSEMGMEEMFTDKANFSGIADAPLKVSKVVQKAFIEVNEEGAEAAAATGLGVVAASLPPPPVELKVNRSFCYILVDKIMHKDKNEYYPRDFTYIPLFSGHVKEPKL